MTAIDVDTGSGPAWIGRTSGLFSRFTSLSNSAGTFWVFCIMLLICADVFARAAFNYPIRGVAELVGYSITGAVYLQLANTLHVGRFTRADFFIDLLDRRRPLAGTFYHVCFDLTGLVVFVLIAHGGYAKLLEAWPSLRFGNEGEFSVLVWPLRAIILFGASLTAIEFGFQLYGHVAALARGIRRHIRAPSATPVGWGALALLPVLVLLIAAVAESDLSRVQVGMLGLLGILVLICLGIHIGVGMITLGLLSIWIMMGNPDIGLRLVKITSNEYLRNYFFGVVPLFVLMGLLVNESDIGRDTFDVARWALRPIKGGLGIATVAANAVFASITGSSIASAAVFTKIATPHMMAHGYTPRFAVGVVAGSSVLGMLIPPSLLLIIYGFVAEQSVGILFIAAIVPGIILAAAMSLAILLMAYFWPGFVGAATQDDPVRENLVSAAVKLSPIAGLVLFILAGIYGGLFTPVEAGAVGALGALLMAVFKRRLSLAGLWRVMIETGHITVAILFLILAANIFGSMLALSGLPQHMGALIGGGGIGFYTFMALYVLVLIVLGMFLDSVSIILIMLPLVLPVAERFGAHPVWFGIITVIVVEMGLLTPPMGLSCFVVNSTLNDDRVSLGDIFAGSLPFVLIMLLVTVLLIAVPELSLLFT